MMRNRLIQLASLLVMVVCLAVVGLLVSPIRAQQKELQLTLAADTLEAVPPHVALATTALGTFRGLAADVLWYRAEMLKREGKFFEANQLAEWITTLQPQFPQVWAFHAWNMAYNISVSTYTPEERWGWVSKGINLLRDKAVIYNPRSPLIHRELGWIFFHKVGRFTDDMHWYYKLQLAREWQEVLGPPPEGVSTEEHIAWFTPVAEAPTSVDRLAQQHPQVSYLIDRLSAMDLKLDDLTLRQIGRFRSFNRSGDAAALNLTFTPEQMDVHPQLPELLADPKVTPVLEPFLSFLRKKVLADRYHMKAENMLDLMKEFGPLDFRHAAAHSLYWGAVGTWQGLELRNTKDYDALNTYRQNIHAIQMLTRMGRISYDPLSEYIDLLPDPRFYQSQGVAYERAMERAREGMSAMGASTGALDNLQDGHENFLHSVVVYSYLYGNEELAQEQYDKLRDLYGNKPHNLMRGTYQRTLTDFVLYILKQDGGMFEHVRQSVDAMITQGLVKGLSNGRTDVFARWVGIARYLYEQNQEKRTKNNALAPRARLGLLPFDELLTETYISYMKTNQHPLRKHRIWRYTPQQLQLETYDRLAPTLRPQFSAFELDADLAMPKPEGLDAYRQAQAEQQKQREAAEKQQGPVRSFDH